MCPVIISCDYCFFFPPCNIIFFNQVFLPLRRAVGNDEQLLGADEYARRSGEPFAVGIYEGGEGSVERRWANGVKNDIPLVKEKCWLAI